MNRPRVPGACSNPFATRFVRPGALAYRFAAGESAAGLVAVLAAHDWWGQIIGPHGSGKSTLLAAIVPALIDAGRMPHQITLHNGQRRIARSQLPKCLAPNTQVVIDGYEQLSWWSRLRLKRLCRRHGCGLLVTAHATVGLPTIYATATSPELAVALVRELVGPAESVDEQEVRSCFARCGGNLRETLFALYDLHERRAANPAATGDASSAS
jgi:hypothetical protein